MKYLIRIARLEDCPTIERLIALSARELSVQDYTPEQIEGALQGAFGVDTQLIKDETYFVAEENGVLVGCGGWSKRKTLFGGDNGEVRNSAELNPETDFAKIRAFFVHPEWVRQGIGRAILARCEAEAKSFGFRSLELMATLPGVRLYSACGFIAMNRVDYTLPSGITIEFVPMKKVLMS
jgi:GNAT superfamily N-acetyltransferase